MAKDLQLFWWPYFAINRAMHRDSECSELTVIRNACMKISIRRNGHLTIERPGSLDNTAMTVTDVRRIEVCVYYLICRHWRLVDEA